MYRLRVHYSAKDIVLNTGQWLQFNTDEKKITEYFSFGHKKLPTSVGIESCPATSGDGPGVETSQQLLEQCILTAATRSPKFRFTGSLIFTFLKTVLHVFCSRVSLFKFSTSLYCTVSANGCRL